MTDKEVGYIECPYCHNIFPSEVEYKESPSRNKIVSDLLYEKRNKKEINYATKSIDSKWRGR